MIAESGIFCGKNFFTEIFCEVHGNCSVNHPQ
jgi:hypothetical protein